MSLKIESNYSKKKNSSPSSIAKLIYNFKIKKLTVFHPPPKKTPYI